MIFSLEALRARHGDSLLLHYGTADAPRVSLIDGGPRGVYGETLKPRLEALAAALRDTGKLGADDPLELDVVMVSHIDDDHVGGLLAFTDELVEDKDRGRVPWVAPKTLWHNTFEDVAGDDAVEADLPPAEVPSEGADAGAVLASVGQARRLRANAELLDWPLNAPFDGLVVAPDAGGRTIELDDDTSLVVLAPREPQVATFRKEWEEQMRKLRAKEAKPAEIAEYLDNSPYNLSSIVVLARQGDRRILLTGDARGDHVISGLEAAGAMDGGKLHVDVLKMPHHGSIRNVRPDFFEQITADHYVISADGKFGNPESETLELIAAARRGNDFMIHMTYATGADDLGARLDAFARTAGRVGFTFERREDPAVSVAVDLGDERVG